jgi:hypothetical protein
VENVWTKAEIKSRKERVGTGIPSFFTLDKGKKKSLERLDRVRIE